MSLADYAHHNEEAERIWWEEEGRHGLGDFDGGGDEYDDLHADREDPNNGPIAEHDDVLSAVWDKLCGDTTAFNSMNLHSGTKPGAKDGKGWVTIIDRFGEDNAFTEVTIEVTVEGRA